MVLFEAAPDGVTSVFVVNQVVSVMSESDGSLQYSNSHSVRESQTR